MRGVIVLILCAAASGARGDTSTSGDPPGGAPRLRLDLAPAPYKEDPSLQSATVRAFKLEAASGKVLWRTPPPSPLVFLVDKKLARAYLDDASAPVESLGLYGGGSIVLDDAAVFFGYEQLLVFGRKDGAIRHQEVIGLAGFGALPFQHGTFDLRCGAEHARRESGNGYFLMACPSLMLLYYMQGFVVFDTRTWARKASHLFPDVTGGLGPWRFPFDGGELTVTRVR